ncbi:hypothetical protein MRB53_028382 [Persea americana]|uniref:Uncharacterized protein n=1 Tax=Persea americana TaxID=3435 RepID=A0ACC2KFK3_PERAE|nr:hypothetical protein MRB53_028382 [Persea americana]
MASSSNSQANNGSSELEDVRRTLRDVASVITAQNGARQEPDLYKKFKGYDPPSFSGTTDPIVAETWLREIEKVFKVMKCVEADKVRLATYKIKGTAEHWWEFEEEALRKTETEITWEVFKDTFNKKYIPKHIRAQKAQEFANLIQGNMTVAEYEAKFSELARYAPHLIPDEASKADKFEKGLRPILMKQVAGFELEDYDKLVTKAFKMEATLALTEQFKDKKHNGNNGNNYKRGSPNKSHGGYGQPQKQRRADNIKTPVVTCSYCQGRHHVDEYYKKNKLCFNCGKSGHMVKDYTQPCRQGQLAPQAQRHQQQQRPPQQQQQQRRPFPNDQKAPTKGRVFALTEKDADASQAVVEGIPENQECGAFCTRCGDPPPDWDAKRG